MADTSAPVGDARPLLAFGPPAAGAIPPRDGPPPFRPVKKPSPSRQGERLTPQFQVLHEALAGQRAQLADTTTASDPELVVVFDLAGTVDQFMRACAKVDGLEFLADLQEDQVDGDDDFYYEDSSGDIGDDGVPQSLYMVMSNARAVEELVRLFELWQQDPSTKFDRGLNSLKQVFGLLRSIRRWDTQDRIRETGLMEEWQQHVELVGTSGSARVEIELWYRSDETRRAIAQDAVEQLVAAAGGQTVRSSTISSIQYHAVLADIPYAQIQTVLEHGPQAIELLTAEDVMLLTPARPMTVSTAGPTEFGLAPRSGEGVGALPRVGMLDGLPLSAHAALAGRLVIDDPDGRSGSYGVGQHGHGTSMAGLIIHGDLSSPGEPIPRALYVRPILQPHPFVREVEEVLPDELLVDLIHRSLHRMFEGDGDDSPTAPSVRVINLSIGDPARTFVRRLSPLAKLVDWLAHKYNVLIVVSAGNHGLEVELPAGELSDPKHLRQAAARAQYAALRHNRLLAPAEAINAITVGAQHADLVVDPMPDTVIDVFEPGGLAGYSAAGFGFRRSVKPDVLLPGGRAIYQRPVAPDGSTPLVAARADATGPGIRVAAPGLAGQLDGTAFTFGTSNAAALATRAIDSIYETLDRLESDPKEFDFPDAQYHPVLAKAMLVHAARWGSSGEALRELLGLSPQRRRRDLTQMLGYGPVEMERVANASRVRPLLIGAASIDQDQRHTFEFPLPPALAATTNWRRLTVTLAWLSPVNTRSQKHRMARLIAGVPRAPLGVEPAEADHNAVLRGTVQHQILEGAAAVGFVAGTNLAISVDCRVDAGKLPAPVRYAIVASIEVNASVQADIHTQVRQGLRARVQSGVQAQVASA